MRDLKQTSEELRATGLKYIAAADLLDGIEGDAPTGRVGRTPGKHKRTAVTRKKRVSGVDRIAEIKEILNNSGPMRMAGIIKAGVPSSAAMRLVTEANGFTRDENKMWSVSDNDTTTKKTRGKKRKFARRIPELQD